MLRGTGCSPTHYKFLLPSYLPQRNTPSRQVICTTTQNNFQNSPSSHVNSSLGMYLFLSSVLKRSKKKKKKKKRKKKNRPFMKFYSNQIKACSKCLNSLFQNQCRLIPFSPFFQRITSHISLDLLGVSLHRMFVSFSSAMIGKNFSNLYCSYYWKMHL